MSKKAKNLTFVVLLVAISAFIVACGKVHNEISQVRISKIAVGNTSNFHQSADNVFTNEIDIEKGLCCTSECLDSTDSSGSCKVTREPFFDGQVRFTISNHLNYAIELSHFYYVVKNYYGGGNDYVSPNITFFGGSIIDGNNQVSGNTNELVTFGAFSDAWNDGQKFVGSNEMISPVTTKNVIFYVTAISQTGEVLTFSRAVPVVFNYFNQCDTDKLACDGILQ